MKLIFAIGLYMIAQIIVWFVTNAQFINKWAADHPWFMALVISGPTTYLFILGTKYSAEYFDGLVWPGRFIGFGLGMVSFAILTSFILGESVSVKTGVSLLLAVALISVQVFWK